MKLNHKVIMLSAATLMTLSPVAANVSQSTTVLAAKSSKTKATAKNKTDQIVLARKSYIYDATGKRNKNYKYQGKTWSSLGKGSKLIVHGTKKINDEVYYFIGNNSYIKASDVATLNGKKVTVTSAKTANKKTTTKTIKLTKNAYVYNSKGKRIKGAGTLKKDSVITYSGTKKINGKNYFYLGKGQYVKTANAKAVKKSTSEVSSKDKQTYIKLVANSVVYNDKGEAPATNKQILEKGTEYQVSKAKKINGKWYYQVGSNQWIKAENAYVSAGKSIITDPNYVEPTPTSKVDENSTIVTLKNTTATYDSTGQIISTDAFAAGQSLRVSSLVWIWVPSENQAVEFYKTASDSKSYIKLSDVSMISGKQLTPTNTADDAKDAVTPASAELKAQLTQLINESNQVMASNGYTSSSVELQGNYSTAINNARNLVSSTSATTAQVKKAINDIQAAKSAMNVVLTSTTSTNTSTQTN